MTLNKKGVKVSTIAEAYQLKYHTVFQFIRRSMQTIQLPKFPRHYLKKLNAFFYRQIEILLLENPKLSLKAIVAALDLPCSKETLRKFLVEKGFKRWTIRNEIVLSERHKQLRVEFARKMLELTDMELNHILFSDEFTVSLTKIGGKLTYFAREERPELNQHKSNFVQKRMFWASVSSAGKASIITVEGSLNSESYKIIVDDWVIPALRWLNWPDVRFMQDNAPCHKSRTIMNHLSEKGVNALDWPPYSPDLNPIENLFGILKSKLSSMKPVSHLDQLEIDVLACWDSIPNEIIYNLCSSFKRRLVMCLHLNGDVIRKY